MCYGLLKKGFRDRVLLRPFLAVQDGKSRSPTSGISVTLLKGLLCLLLSRLWRRGAPDSRPHFWRRRAARVVSRVGGGATLEEGIRRDS